MSDAPDALIAEYLMHFELELMRLPEGMQMVLVGMLMSRFIQRISEQENWDRIAGVVHATMMQVLADAKQEQLH